MRVSIVIPTKNGLPWLCDSLGIFLNQDFPGEYEILVVDSGSTDGTLEWLSRADGVRCVSIAPENFGHGKTRNAALQWARGGLLLFTVQDAAPRNTSWLMDMVEALESTGSNAVCGGQAVRQDWRFNPWEWHLDEDLQRPVRVWDGRLFSGWTLDERLTASSWDNVNALYRRSALETIPFPDVTFGEDMGWAHAALRQGFKLAQVPACAVYHYHVSTATFVRDRTWAACALVEREFGLLGNAPATSRLAAHADRRRSWKKLRTIVKKLNFFAALSLPGWLLYNLRLKWHKGAALRDSMEALRLARMGSHQDWLRRELASPQAPNLAKKATR